MARLRKDASPSGPTEGHDIKTKDSISGHEVDVADKKSSLSWLRKSIMNRKLDAFPKMKYQLDPARKVAKHT